MTVTQLMIVPGILIGAFLVFLGWLALRIATAHLAAVRSRAGQSQAVSAGWQSRFSALASQERRQADVIAAVICELESRPATYQTFPAGLRGDLMAAHESASQLERNANR